MVPQKKQKYRDQVNAPRELVELTLFVVRWAGVLWLTYGRPINMQAFPVKVEKN